MHNIGRESAPACFARPQSCSVCKTCFSCVPLRHVSVFSTFTKSIFSHRYQKCFHQEHKFHAIHLTGMMQVVFRDFDESLRGLHLASFSTLSCGKGRTNDSKSIGYALQYQAQHKSCQCCCIKVFGVAIGCASVVIMVEFRRFERVSSYPHHNMRWWWHFICL